MGRMEPLPDLYKIFGKQINKKNSSGVLFILKISTKSKKTIIGKSLSFLPKNVIIVRRTQSRRFYISMIKK